MKDPNTLKVFILEDDTWYGSMLHHYLSMNPDYDVRRFENSQSFFQHLHERPDVITLDYSLPDMDGDQVLKKITQNYPDAKVIVISGQEDMRCTHLRMKAVPAGIARPPNCSGLRTSQ